MELASDLRALSSAEDFQRFIEARYPTTAAVDEERLRLRLGQRLLARLLTSSTPRSIFIEFPTGYGKTRSAIVAAHLLRARGAITHILVLVPSDEQRTKWLEDVAGEFSAVSGEKVESWDAADPAALGYFASGKCRLFVTTIQSAIGAAGGTIVSHLLSRGSWLIVIDEAQYYAPDAEGSPWSFGLKAILDRPNVRHWLAMSATPLRRDRKYGLLGSPDIVVSMRVAADEHAIRPVDVRAEEYAVNMTTADGELIENVHTSDIERWARENGGDLNITAWEIRKRVRYYDKFLSGILDHTIDVWSRKQTHKPGEHQILVFAMSVRHAKHVAAAINTLQNDPGFADYIGDTADPEACRKSEENDLVLGRFKRNELPCLVQVAKAGVGFDNKRCSVLCFLNLIGATPLLLQFIGRGLRRNEAIHVDDDVCDIIVSKDHPGMEMFRTLNDVVGSGADAEEEDDGADDTIGCFGPRFSEISEFFLLDASFRHAEIFKPLDPAVQDVARRLVESNLPATREAVARVNESGADLLELIAKVMEAEQERKGAELTLRVQHEQARIQVNDAVRTLVANAGRRITGRSDWVDAALRGRLYGAVHRQWMRRGGGRQNEATVEALRAKHDWLRSVNAEVAAGRPPAWLAA